MIPHAQSLYFYLLLHHDKKKVRTALRLCSCVVYFLYGWMVGGRICLKLSCALWIITGAATRLTDKFVNQVLMTQKATQRCTNVNAIAKNDIRTYSSPRIFNHFLHDRRENILGLLNVRNIWHMNSRRGHSSWGSDSAMGRILPSKTRPRSLEFIALELLVLTCCGVFAIQGMV